MTLYDDYLKVYENKPQRKIHVEGVAAFSVALAKKYHLNTQDMKNAAYIHDLTKYEEDAYHQELFKKYQEEAFLNLPSFLYHGYSAGLLAKHVYHQNEEVINAVTHHIIGRPKMSRFEKILMLSDKIEPSRFFEGIEDLRTLAFQDIDRAFIAFLKVKYTHDKAHQYLNSYALETYKAYLKEHL